VSSSRRPILIFTLVEVLLVLVDNTLSRGLMNLAHGPHQHLSGILATVLNWLGPGMWLLAIALCLLLTIGSATPPWTRVRWSFATAVLYLFHLPLVAFLCPTSRVATHDSGQDRPHAKNKEAIHPCKALIHRSRIIDRQIGSKAADHLLRRGDERLRWDARTNLQGHHRRVVLGVRNVEVGDRLLQGKQSVLAILGHADHFREGARRSENAEVLANRVFAGPELFWPSSGLRWPPWAQSRRQPKYAVGWD